MKEDITVTAKLLYGLLLNRSMLSRENNWLSPEGCVYIVYTNAQLREDLKCSRNTVKKALNELEDLNLIKRERRGLNEACRIFVLIPGDQDLTSPGGRIRPLVRLIQVIQKTVRLRQ